MRVRYRYTITKIRTGEIDFMIEKSGHILPIELKSGSDYKTHKALNNLMEVRGFNIPEAVTLPALNVEREDKLLYLPICMASFLKEKEEPCSFTTG